MGSQCISCREAPFEHHCHAGGRGLLDVRSRMQQNAEMQRFITREAEDMGLDMMKQEMVNKEKVRGQGFMIMMYLHV